MTLPVLQHLNLNLNQLLSALAENVTSDPGTATKGRVIYRTDTNTFKVGNGTTWDAFYVSTTRLDQIVAPNNPVSFNSQRITGLADPSGAQDGATKNYVDGLITGQDWKASVRAASTANVTLSGPGATIDGVAMAANDRVLLKNQTAPAENGIWVWNGAAVPMTRATDADANAEVTAGLTVPVAEGTVNADTLWILTTNDAIVVGTTSLAFSQVPTTMYSAGTGLSLTGAQFSLSVPVSIANGGTNAITAAAARTNLGAVGKFAADITGNGALTSFAVTHNLNTKDIDCQVWEVSTDTEVLVEKVRTDVNTVTINFAQAVANAKVYRVVVTG